MTIIYTDLVKILANEKSYLIFKAINENGVKDPNATLNLSKKIFYTTLSKMRNADLVKKYKGKWYPTQFGVVVFHVIDILESAISDYYPLKVVDSMETSIPNDQRNVIIGRMIKNSRIRSLITCPEVSSQ